MKPELVNITPALASRMLGGNTRNRSVSQTHVDRLAAAILAGEWKLNGDAIRMDGNTLVDGQHRLLACVKSGKPIKTLVIRDVPQDVFQTIDIGKKRDNGDTLSVLGEKNCDLLAAALNVVYRVVAQKLHKIRLSNTQIQAGLAEHPRIREAATEGKNFKTLQKLMRISWIVGLLYLFRKKDELLADCFFSALDDGSNLQATDPIFVLRQRLIANQLSHAKLPDYIVGALTIKAWNASRAGEKVRSLRWSRDGSNAEEFPKIK